MSVVRVEQVTSRGSVGEECRVKTGGKFHVAKLIAEGTHIYMHISVHTCTCRACVGHVLCSVLHFWRPEAALAASSLPVCHDFRGMVKHRIVSVVRFFFAIRRN